MISDPPSGIFGNFVVTRARYVRTEDENGKLQSRINVPKCEFLPAEVPYFLILFINLF